MMTLPPERDLPGGDRMADEILAGVEPARPAPGRSRALLAVLVAAAAVVVVALVLVQLLPLGRETAPAEPSPSPVVSAETGTVADLGGGNTATVSSAMVLESYPVQFVYVGEVCGPKATDAVWEHRVDDGEWTSEAATTPAQPEEATLRGCEPLELTPLGTFTDGTAVEFRVSLGEVEATWGPAPTQLVDPSPTPAPDPSPEASEPASPTTAPSPPATPQVVSPPPATRSAEPTSSGAQRPSGPVELTAEVGQTVSTRYFDVTVTELATDDSGLAWGAKVQVCYAAPHPEQNADATTRTSLDPWSFSVQDDEGPGAGPQWIKARDLPPSTRWSPGYATKLLKLGECNRGWVQVEPGNPDLFLPTLRYAPADFGDDVRWEFNG